MHLHGPSVPWLQVLGLCHVAQWLEGAVTGLHDAILHQMRTSESACQMCMQAQDSESQGVVGGRDLLSLLLEEKREDGTPAFSQREVHDEVFVMLPLQNRIQTGTLAMLYLKWYHHANLRAAQNQQGAGLPRSACTLLIKLRWRK